MDDRYRCRPDVQPFRVGARNGSSASVGHAESGAPFPLYLVMSPGPCGQREAQPKPPCNAPGGCGVALEPIRGCHRG